MNAVCPVFFKLISLIEQYHPRVALYWELTRCVFCISHTSLLPQLKLLLLIGDKFWFLLVKTFAIARPIDQILHSLFWRFDILLFVLIKILFTLSEHPFTKVYLNIVINRYVHWLGLVFGWFLVSYKSGKIIWLVLLNVGVKMWRTWDHRAQKLLGTNNFSIMLFSWYCSVILYRIMFLYLGNMYVLVISLLNKINQVRDCFIASVRIVWLVLFLQLRLFSFIRPFPLIFLASLFAVQGFSYLWCEEHNCPYCYHGYVKHHSWWDILGSCMPFYN